MVRLAYYDQTFGGQDFSRWKHHFDGKLKTSEDARKAIETMLYSLGDPYTRVLDADDTEGGSEEPKFSGVGMQLGMNKELRVIVISPIEDTPSFRAGVKPGWEILEIDGKPVKGRSLDMVVKSIRGPNGSTISMTFLHDSKKESFKLTRTGIPLRAIARVDILPERIGYIRLDDLSRRTTTSEMRAALLRVNETDSLIIDLRNVRGEASMANAIGIANLFVSRGVIASTVDSDGYKQSTFSTGRPIYTKPLAVLVNRGTAQNAEVLAAALQETGGAKLVGQKTFGIGTVQNTNRLDDGTKIKLTIALLLTPKDKVFQRRGIAPDIEVPLKESDYESGHGPWWIDINYKFDRKVEPGMQDIQLAKAIEWLSGSKK